MTTIVYVENKHRENFDEWKKWTWFLRQFITISLSFFHEIYELNVN